MSMVLTLTYLLTLSAFAGCVTLLACPIESLAALASANASATVVAPVTIPTTTEMLFEKISRNSFGSVLVLGSSYDHPVRGNSSQSLASGKNAETLNATFSVTLPHNVTISDDSSNDTTLNTFAGNSYGAYILSGTHQIIPVEGKFKESIKQATGNYKGKLNFTVYYN